ncbi:hypothetical protein [Halalkalicoccus salilacus]|uniref:hypothetical protein n=1 Tax=Halalkalicoccus salilacus TaxID=3117459 RepID=UPI00300E6F77
MLANLEELVEHEDFNEELAEILSTEQVEFKASLREIPEQFGNCDVRIMRAARERRQASETGDPRRDRGRRNHHPASRILGVRGRGGHCSRFGVHESRQSATAGSAMAGSRETADERSEGVGWVLAKPIRFLTNISPPPNLLS